MDPNAGRNLDDQRTEARPRRLKPSAVVVLMIDDRSNEETPVWVVRAGMPFSEAGIFWIDVTGCYSSEEADAELERLKRLIDGR